MANWSVVLIFLHMRGIPRALGCNACFQCGGKLEHYFWSILAVFVSSVPRPPLSTVYQCNGCPSSGGYGNSWLGCQVLPAICSVSILELAANSGSPRMSQAPILHRAMQLVIQKYIYIFSVFFCFLKVCHRL